MPPPELVGEYVGAALGMREHQGAMPFAVVDRSSGEVIGSTRYCNVEPRHRRLEIGHTWYARRAQRTGANTECKLLLLGHAFERLRSSRSSSAPAGSIRRRSGRSSGSARSATGYCATT